MDGKLKAGWAMGSGDLVGIWGSSQYDLQEAPTDATLRVNLGAWRPGSWSPHLAEAMTKDRL